MPAPTPRLTIGIDFDNTIVCYDGVFHRLAVEQTLVPDTVPRNKNAVRDYLREAGREDDWTELQGLVYGCHMDEAELFPGVKEFFSAARTQGFAIQIISHKTQFPARGEKWDLHKSASLWLVTKKIEQPAYFLPTREEKLKTIAAAGCTVFIDDLPEVLGETNFPKGTKPILFDPNGSFAHEHFLRLRSWYDAMPLILELFPE